MFCFSYATSTWLFTLPKCVCILILSLFENRENKCVGFEDAYNQKGKRGVVIGLEFPLTLGGFFY
eukprot:UN10818